LGVNSDKHDIQRSHRKSEMTAETKQIVFKEIGSKRGKFSEQDVSALKGNDTSSPTS
jgi:hypothetical protein